MNPRKFLITCISVFLLVLLLGLMFRASKRSSGANGSDFGESLRRAMGSAQQGLSGPGAIDGIADRRQTGSSGAGAAARPGAAGTGDPDAAKKTSGTAAAAARARRRLELIRMKDRTKGLHRMYGSGLNPRRSERSARVPVRPGPPPDEEAVAGAMERFLRRLRGTAAPEESPRRGANPAARFEDEGGGGARGEDSPILTTGKIDGKVRSRTLELLQKVNKDGASSVSMSRSPSFQDGSRDKSGKQFDGNPGDREVVPIEHYEGAFGEKLIKASAPETGGRVPDLK